MKLNQVQVKFRYYGTDAEYNEAVRRLSSYLSADVTFIFTKPLDQQFSDCMVCSGAYWPFTTNDASAFAALANCMFGSDTKIADLEIEQAELPIDTN